MCITSAVLVIAGHFFLEKINFFWVLRIINFFVLVVGQKVSGLEERIAVFAEKIIEAGEEDTYDEILVVGHSVGSILAVLVMTIVEKKCHQKTKISLLTLGECIPPISVLSDAGWFRNILVSLGKRSFFWVDVTSSIDGICFFKTDIVKMHAHPKEAIDLCSPVLLSARFFKLFTKKRYRNLRYDWFNIHFLYLMSTDFAGVYDYYAITCGSISLQKRFTPPKRELS